MFFADLGQVLRRRWYLVLIGLLLAAGTGAATYATVPPVYSASAEVLLLPPDPAVPEGQNLYLALSGLTPAGDVLARALSDPKTAAELADAGARGTYSVELDGDSPAPIVLVQSEGGTVEEAVTTLGLVMDRLPLTLREIQAAASVPSNAYITPSEVTRTSNPDKSTKPQIRALVVFVGAALVLALLGTAALDALLRRPGRARRRHVQEDAVAPEEASSFSPELGLKGSPPEAGSDQGSQPVTRRHARERRRDPASTDGRVPTQSTAR